ncbi:MAG: DUF2070 family protein [Thermoplasmata archaeon]
MPDANEEGTPPPKAPGYRAVLLTAPEPRLQVIYITLFSLGYALVLFLGVTAFRTFVEGFVAVFLAPALLSAALTGPLASAFGGRFELRRSLFLVLTSLAIGFPLAGVWRIAIWLEPSWASTLVLFLLFLQGPILWFRYMSLFGVSRPRHSASLLPALFHPLLTAAGILLVLQPAWPSYVAATVFLAAGLGCAILLLSTSDRPLQREFGVSGVALIRPLIDHVNARDPAATNSLETFFRRFSIPADLRVTVVRFDGPAGPVATLVLPTVHPGPFASLGASDLPRKISDKLGPTAGVVFVPHTPCNHDLDLPGQEEMAQVAAATEACFHATAASLRDRASPLLSPGPGSVARAQLVGDVAIVLVTQAPRPTDDIDFAVGDQVFQHFRSIAGPGIALIDAHNSYVEDEGDVSYGTPGAAQLISDAESAVMTAERAAVPGTIRVGAAIRDGYRTVTHGIGPHGIRAMVIDAAGQKSAYVLVDGNNLVAGLRDPILAALRPLVDACEVMTTDNHVVHEVDGSINPVGERYPLPDLTRDVVGTVQEALAHLTPVSVKYAVRDVRSVRVLQPAWTIRLLTSLGDTFSIFTNALLTTFLLLLTTSLVVFLVFR